MTFLEHGLYGGAIVLKNNPNLYWWSFIAGVFPDIPPLIFAIHKVDFKKALKHFTWKAIEGAVPESVYKVYDFSHSFITTLILFLVLYLIKPELSILAIAYGLHIVCDIPFHNSRFSTRFLYPLSNFHIHGYSQRKHRWIHGANLLLLIILYWFLLKQP